LLYWLGADVIEVCGQTQTWMLVSVFYCFA
jgi:hypothetical protein